MRKIVAAVLCLAVLSACFLPVPSFAAGWDYPLSPLIVANREGYLTLANKDVRLDAGYEPLDLVDLKVRSTVQDAKLRKGAADALEAMFLAAEEAGFKLYVKSAYRSYKTQKTMYSNRLESMGRDDGLVQAPGASDHQTGLGVDVLNYEWTKKSGMNAKFASEPEAVWMAEHCWEFGFVIRYESDKEDITGIKYEPWHLRYVGLDVALYMREKHYALEEFCAEISSVIASYESGGDDFLALVYLMNIPNEKHVLEYTADGEEEYSVFYD